MGRNRIAKLLTIVMLCVTGCAKPGFETSRKNLIRNQAKRSSRATLLDPEQPQILPSTHFAAGRMFEAQGHFTRAIEQYAKTIAVSHNHVAAHHRLGLIYSKLGRHDDAIKMLRKAVALKPDNAVLHNNLGFELMFVKDWDGAAKQLAEAIAIEPNFARAHINMGMTLSKRERFDDALVHFRAVLPESDAQYNLGLMYRSAQRYDDAASSFERILVAAPNFQAAQTQLADIAPHLNLTPVTKPEVDATTDVPTLTDNRQEVPDDLGPFEDGPDHREVVVERVRLEPKVILPSTTRTIADDPNPEQAVVLLGTSAETEPLNHAMTARNMREEPVMIPPSTTRAITDHHAIATIVATIEPPQPVTETIASPWTTQAMVADAPTDKQHDEIDRELASLGSDDWLANAMSEEEVEIASAAEPFDLFDLEEPCEEEEFIGTEVVDGLIVPTEGVVLPVPADEVATPSEVVADADPLGAVPFGRLNDEVARIDDEIRCLIDEALEAMAVAIPQTNASDAVRIDPVFVEPIGEPIIGDFVADSTEPIRHPPHVELSTDLVVPTTDTYELRLPEDRRSDPVSVDSSPIEKTVSPVESPMPQRNEARRIHWRARLNSLNTNLVALRDEINCLEAADAETTGTKEHVTAPVATTKVDAKPKAKRIAKKTPRRVTPRSRSRSNNPKMMLAYKPTKAPSILDTSRPRSADRRSTPIARVRHDEPPAALARPLEASDIFAAVEIGPAFPAPLIGPAHAETEQDEFDWDVRFGDLHNLMSITQNEIRCWAEIEEAQEEKRVADNARSKQQRYKTRLTPVRFRPRQNPFYNK